MLQDGASTDRVVRSKRGRILIVSLIGLGIIILLTAGSLYPSLNEWLSADRSVERSRLRLGQVMRGDLLRDVSVQGSIVAADHPTLVSPAQGVVSLLVRAGDVVSRDTAMARIESPELENSLQQEQSALLSLESVLDRVKIANRQANLKNRQDIALLEVKLRAGGRAVERTRALFEAGLGSAIDYQKSMDELEVVKLELAHARTSAELALETMEFEVRSKQLDLERQRLIVLELERKVRGLVVVSPVDGLVSRIEVKDKDTVQPNQALFSVVDLSEFEVEVLIPENYADEIGIETPAAILYEGREFAGRVKSLSPEVENSQVKGIVAFTKEPPNNLKQNQRVSTRLILDSRQNVLKVPRGPFLESMGGRQAYRVQGGLAELIPVTVGAISVTEVEITSGLREGDQIVLSDLARFEGATRILLRD